MSLRILSDETWRRHANPLSVWTRYAAFPFLIAAIWSRVWVGWGALIPIALVIAWLIWNPRAFPPPRTTDSWASKAVLGERIWTGLKSSEVPLRFRGVLRVATAIGLIGLGLLVWGLYSFDLGMTVASAILVLTAKTWFIDRMVWLFDVMKDSRPEYRSWLY